MALAGATVAASIAGLTVSGVTMKGLGAIPESADIRECPMLYPNPDGFISGFDLAIDSFGSTAGKKTATYKLNYVFLHSKAGTGRGLFDEYADMVAKALAILDAVIANDAITGCVDIQPQDVLNFGPVSDPSGVLFHGAHLVFTVTEFVN